jgi:UDP-2,3-diacylglucosamine pyrophosphatase LpxH
MAKRLVLVVVGLVSFALAGPDFDMVVLGDLTGSAQESTFETILNEVKLLKPALLMNVGDLIEGYTKSHDTLEQEWDTIIRLLHNTGTYYRLTPGNHDITDVMSETVFVRHFGNPYYSFNYNGSHFLVIDNSRWDSAGAMPAAELEWIDRDLALNRLSRWTFVFMHRSYWTSALRQGKAERLHDIFKRYRVNFVFSGHDHFYCSALWDSIHYIQVGPSGSRYKEYGDEERGAFQNYLRVHVADSSVRLEVVRPGNILPVDCVTLQDIALLDSLDRRSLELSRLDLLPGARVEDSLAATVRNVFNSVLSTRCVWDLDQTNWSVEPETVVVVCNPGASTSNQFQVRLEADRSPYPLPSLNLTCPYGNGKQHTVSRLLPIRCSAVCHGIVAPRLDGLLNDRSWRNTKPIREFGSKDGGLCPTEPFEVYLAHDDSMLYLAVRCTETQMLSLKTDETARDGKVADDDNLNFLLCPNPDSAVYYQLIINPAGTIWDRKCRMENGKSVKDNTWDGNWRVANSLGKDYWILELSIPLSDFGLLPAAGQPSAGGRPAEWSFNVARFQARNKAVGIYQVPFVSDPGQFARLTLAPRVANGEVPLATFIRHSSFVIRHFFTSTLRSRSSRP